MRRYKIEWPDTNGYGERVWARSNHFIEPDAECGTLLANSAQEAADSYYEKFQADRSHRIRVTPITESVTVFEYVEPQVIEGGAKALGLSAGFC